MKKVLVANWKQNMNLEEVQAWISTFGELVKDFESKVAVIICPSAPYLGVVSEFAKDFEWISVGSQDISSSENGTHTGEIGASQARDYAEYCILGHSERGEKRSDVAKKVEQALIGGLTPIIGFVEFEQLDGINTKDSILLWEDPGNISQGGVYKPMPAEKIAVGINNIREKAQIEHGLLYGGSINRKNAADLGNIAGLDGGVVGGASLDPQHFFELVKAFGI
jgi:triosephosphate isomerase